MKGNCVRASWQQTCISHLVHLVCGAVLADSDRDGGVVWQSYPQLHIRHSIVVLQGKSTHNKNSWRVALTHVWNHKYVPLHVCREFHRGCCVYSSDCLLWLQKNHELDTHEVWWKGVAWANIKRWDICAAFMQPWNNGKKSSFMGTIPVNNSKTDINVLFKMLWVIIYKTLDFVVPMVYPIFWNMTKEHVNAPLALAERYALRGPYLVIP